MESGDYYRYRAELEKNRTVTFPDRLVLVDFLAETWSMEYENFLTQRMSYCTVAEYESDMYAVRMLSEPWEVKMRVKEYLISQFVDADTLGSKIKNLLKHKKWIPEFRYDTAQNTEVFETILAKVSPSDTPMNVFRNHVMYIVNNWTTLNMEYF